jgi:CubicO group peptidase (beta-lactamase class C family)
MIPESPPHEDAGSPTRRTFLAGLGSLGLAGIGAAAGRARAGTTGTPGRDPASSTAASSGDAVFADPGSLEALVDDVMGRRIGERVPGASVAVVEGDTPVLVKGYGTADVEADAPVRAAETEFRVGSVGKLVTWTAVMQGVERGVLDLDEDVDTYLEDSAVSVPETDDEPVTLRHLGTHTAGFESAIDPGLVVDPDALEPLETVLAERRPSRVRPPGELVGYSNYGAALAGHVVAETHDTTFEEYVQSELFDPLGMTHSTFAQPVPDDHPGTLAAGHTREGGTFTTVDEPYIAMRPAGSMRATASDMAAFASAHLGNGAVGRSRILEPETATTMHERHHVRHRAVTNWRYGFHEYGRPGANLVAHSGATVHFSSRLVLALDDDVGVFVSYNVNDPAEPPSAVVDEILSEYGLLASPSPPSRTSVPGGRARADTVAGEYRVTYLPQSGPLQVADLLARITVDAAGPGRLVTGTLDGDRREWVETEPYVYREVGGRDVLAFEVADGEVEVLNASSEPTGVHRPVPTHERRLVTGGVVGGALTGFGLSLVGRGAVGAWQRWTRRRGGERDEGGSDD